MKKLLSVSSLALLCACSSNWDPDAVASMDSEGTAFDKSIKNEYVELAIIERSRGDWDEVDRLLTKAISASEGDTVAITPPQTETLMKTDADTLGKAYGDLQAQMKLGARDKKPYAAARAQIGYECMLNAYNWQIEADMKSCGDYYAEAMAELKDGAGKRQTETVKKAPGTAAAPAAITADLRKPYSEDGKTYMVKNGQYLVYYAFGSAEPAQDVDGLFKDIVADYNVTNPEKVAVSGYADTAGSKRVNQALSLRRAKTVADGLAKAGIDKGKIEAKGYGETNLAVQTADGVAEPKNRRTVIEFKN